MIPALTNATPQRVTRDSGSQPSRAPLPIDAKGPARLTSPNSPYDTLVLLKRAKQWRAEAARVAPGAMRAFCLAEADWCERRVNLSRATPVFRGYHG
jgi:hypothetical protein